MTQFPAEPEDKSVAGFVKHSALRRQRNQYAQSKAIGLLPDFFDDDGNRLNPGPEEFRAYEQAYDAALFKWDADHASQIQEILKTQIRSN